MAARDSRKNYRLVGRKRTLPVRLAKDYRRINRRKSLWRIRKNCTWKRNANIFRIKRKFASVSCRWNERKKPRRHPNGSNVGETGKRPSHVCFRFERVFLGSTCVRTKIYCRRIHDSCRTRRNGLLFPSRKSQKSCRPWDVVRTKPLCNPRKCASAGWR